MARFLVLLLIALLPLRGFAAERMVYAVDAPAQTHVHVSEHVSMQGMPAECVAMHGERSVQVDTSSAASDTSTSGHEGCHFCQLCMPLAALESAQAVAVHALPHAVPVATLPNFDSADSARSVKPPIS